MNKYEIAWNKLLEVLNEKTGWGRNDLKKKMDIILMQAEIESLKQERNTPSSLEIIR